MMTLMPGWTDWKKGFDAWENATAKYMEVWLRSPVVLGPGGKLLSTAMKAKTQADKMTAQMWGGLGLPTKRDQERALHVLNQVSSRLVDLEDKLEDQRQLIAQLQTENASLRTQGTPVDG